jgi:hypothetical protein
MGLCYKVTNDINFILLWPIQNRPFQMCAFGHYWLKNNLCSMQSRVYNELSKELKREFDTRDVLLWYGDERRKSSEKSK